MNQLFFEFRVPFYKIPLHYITSSSEIWIGWQIIHFKLIADDFPLSMELFLSNLRELIVKRKKNVTITAQ